MKLRIVLFTLLLALTTSTTGIFAKTSKPTPTPSKSTTIITPVKKEVKRLSSKKTSVKYGGVTFHVDNGKYYKYTNSRYVPVAPPKGLRVTVIPPHSIAFRLNNILYHCCAGVIYREIASNQYEVVEPTSGMIVPELPEVNVRKVNIDGKIYFEFDNILYKQIPTATGLQYEIVGSLED